MALTTFGLKASIKKFGDKGLLSVKKELKQMHNLTVFVPVKADSLTAEQKDKYLPDLAAGTKIGKSSHPTPSTSNSLIFNCLKSTGCFGLT